MYFVKVKVVLVSTETYQDHFSENYLMYINSHLILQPHLI